MAVTKSYWADLPSSLQAIGEMQLGDTLCQELELTVGQPATGRIHYQEQQGVLYWGVPSKYSGFNYQLVVPDVLEFLSYFHNSPFQGHLGRMKMLLKVLEVAWWPTVRKDVWSHVRACLSCQQHKGSNIKPAGHLQKTEVKAPDESGLHGAIPTQ